MIRILEDIQERVNELSRGSKVAMVVINLFLAAILTAGIVILIVTLTEQYVNP